MDYVEALQLATDLVKRAGFVLHYISMNSESCYYRHPAVKKERLLRISSHKGSNKIGNAESGRRDHVQSEEHESFGARC